MKVLIVDDNKQIISILEAYAKKEGYQTVIAVDGQEALDVFQRERPDIILFSDTIIIYALLCDYFFIVQKIQFHYFRAIQTMSCYETPNSTSPMIVTTSLNTEGKAVTLNNLVVF